LQIAKIDWISEDRERRSISRLSGESVGFSKARYRHPRPPHPVLYVHDDRETPRALKRPCGVPRVRKVRVTLATETTTFREALAAPRYGDVVMHRDVAVHSNVHDINVTPQTRYSTKQIKTDGSRARRRYAFTCALDCRRFVRKQGVSSCNHSNHPMKAGATFLPPQ
jgi:hypothetical protein